ncbi:MAG: serine/threonine protein kinase [Pseudomonadota bacterium]
MKGMGKKLIVALALGGLLAGCDSGDINISPSTADNSTDNSVNNSNNTTTTPVPDVNPCASYTNTGGQTIQGTYDGLDCTYTPTFVDAGNNLTVDMTVPALPNGGAHIFQGSLFVGENYTSNAELAAAGIAEGGDGPTLTIEAGATLAFQSQQQFVIIMRGSQIFAVGTATAPITFTSVSDIESQRAVAGGGAATLAFDAVQQWGGMVINGFGISNRCPYTGALAVDANGRVTGQGTLALNGECNVRAEGAAGLDESQYGGGNYLDSSGRLEYVRTKHTGAEVANGDELNGISFGGVGKNTIIRNLQIYSSYDDGIELFGGSVDIQNYVAVYVRDDSIDIDEGYNGTITNALVIQSETDGNHCIESDGVASWSAGVVSDTAATANINSRPVITNLTCIVSPNGAATATHDPGAGWLIRERNYPVISDSLVVTIGTDSADSNYCFSAVRESDAAFANGDAAINSTIFTCNESSAGGTIGGTADTTFLATNGGNQFASAGAAGAAAANLTAAADSDWQILEGTPPIYTIAPASMVVGGAAPTAAAPASGRYGALSTAIADWTLNWTYGIHDGSRGAPLWFE